MAAEDQVVAFDHFKFNGGNSVPVNTENGIEAATQSWQPGAPLIRSSGKLAEAADDPTAAIVGFACAPATGVTDTPVSYIPAWPGIEFEATLEDQSGGDHALTQASMFVAYSVRQRTSNGAWYLDFNDTTNLGAIVVGLVDPIGTVQGRVRARLLDTVTIYND